MIITLSLDSDLIDRIDRERGRIPRSSFVNQMLQEIESFAIINDGKEEIDKFN